MKQSLETGKYFIALALVFSLLFSACGRLARSTSDATTVQSPATSSATRALINLNTASVAELERLPGVGPMLAKRIITYREEHGRFRRAEHLMMVRGVSDRKFRELQSLVRVD